MRRFQLLIDGGWINPMSDAWIESKNPFTGEVWAEISRYGANDVRFGLAAAAWTKDIGRALRMSEKLKAGTI